MLETELLAPAKNKEIAFAAIDCGADAVYIGASSFGARQNAGNSLEDIKEVADYAHKFWAKVFVTVNTIIKDEELDEAVELIKKLNDIGVDAVIIQDMGLLEKLIELNLSIPIHASTQCDNRQPEKIEFFNKVGLSRVVLARELSLEQIRDIHKNNPNIELEAFIHGALCVSYSGQCYLSQFIGGRSANRGECAQPCRKQYTVIDNKGKKYIYPYPLCLKDFNASNHIENMIKSGIYSFKIEGRLKDVGFVKNIVAYYRRELDKYSKKASSGKSFIQFSPKPQKSFNRGFTDYFLKSRTDCYNKFSPKSQGEFLGTMKQLNPNTVLLETNEPINNQDGICYVQNNIMNGFLVNKTEKSKKGYIVYPNKPVDITECVKAFRNIDTAFEKELLKPTKRQIELNIQVIGNTISLTDEDSINIKTEITSSEKAKNQIKMNETFIKQFSKTGDSDFYIKDISITSDIPFMPVSEINNLRREAFNKLMQKRISSYKRKAQRPLKHSHYFKTELDYRANIHNKYAQQFYEKCGSDINEWSLESKMPDRQIELMRTKHCIKYALNMCKSPLNLYLKDEKGIQYPLKFDCNKCEMAVLSPDI